MLVYSGALEDLSYNPLWYRRVKKLGGNESRYRFRVGRWRVLFTLTANKIQIYDIFLKKGRDDYHRRIKDI